MSNRRSIAPHGLKITSGLPMGWWWRIRVQNADSEAGICCEARSPQFSPQFSPQLKSATR
ncbi:MAG: hypothetical protein WCD53_28400 [Microcoleus sp.]